MCDNDTLYNWDKYKSLSKQTAKIKTAAYEKDGETVPSWYSFELKQPAANEWDVGEGKDNFFGPCYEPYWHEAHHIVPNSNLRNAILDFAKDHPAATELVTTVRRGLLKEKYNLNHKVNMITLPLDKEVADAIGLPRHRTTAKHRNHAAYGKNVYNKVTEHLNGLKEQLEEHEKAGYKSLKKKIDNLSEQLFNQIKKSGAESLDEMKADEFDEPAESRPPTSTF
ncbi:MAG: hypothetical protein HKN13_12645 [Rhodothermales bacterium]|nr:hypothetical protein [Rhodothermales bacterium]